MYFDLEINDGEPLIVPLPRQMDPLEAEELSQTMDTATNTANVIATGNIVINVFLGASLKLLWGLINTFQFIVFFTEWKVQIPANSLIALDTLRKIALGEFIPTDWLTEPLAETFLEGHNGSTDNS